MPAWLSNLFGKRKATVSPDWQTDRCLFQLLKSNITEDGSLKNSELELPDETKNENELKFAADFLDAFSSKAGSPKFNAAVAELTDLLRIIAGSGDLEAQATFYRKITTGTEAINIADALVDNIKAKALPVEPHLFQFAKDLAFKTDNRNSVKFGIAILGRCGNKSIIKDIKILGLHEEFTYFSIVALILLSDNLQQDLWYLATKVHSWGRIRAVEGLTKLPLSQEIRDWLILEGHKCGFPPSPTALDCAIAGELHLKLQSLEIDYALFRAAGEILDSLLDYGSTNGIDDYVHAAAVVECYVRHSRVHHNDPYTLVVLSWVESHLMGLQKDFSVNNCNGWTQEIITRCLANTAELIKGHDWAPQIVDALQNGDKETQWIAWQAACVVKLDVWSVVWESLQKEPERDIRWSVATRAAGAAHASELITYAVRILPLELISTGPEEKLGLSKGYELYQPLDSVLRFLKDYPGQGEEIILAALNSPIMRNRSSALSLLGMWTKDNWSEAIIVGIEKLRNIEPHSKIRQDIEKLLNGSPLWQFG